MLFFTWFKRTFKKVSGTGRTRAIMQTFLTAIAIIDLIVALATKKHDVVASFVRPFMLIILS